MQPRTLDQIMAELGSVYDPQVNSIRQRQALLPEQLKSEEAGLEAKKVNAFDSILSGARGRGLGFSGIPLGEQAKYTASEFLPAVARARAAAKEQAMSLEDAILGIRERQQSSAMAQRQYEQQRWDAYQSEQRQLAEARRASAAAASSAANPSFGNLLGSLTGDAAKAPAANQADAQQRAYNAIRSLFTMNDPKTLVNTYNAIKTAANKGSAYDKIKLQIMQQLKPGLFQNGNLDQKRIQLLASNGMLQKSLAINPDAYKPKIASF